MLNEKQDEAIEFIVNSIGKEKEVGLFGRAGCGKSFTIAELLKRIEGKYTYALTATTHKACEVVASLSDQGAKTIHSHLGLMLKYDKGNQVLKANPNKQYDNVDLLIIDEYSMINEELYKFIEKIGFNIAKTVLYVGDKYQLIMGSLNESSGIEYAELTEPMRQEADSGIVRAANELVESIEARGVVEGIPEAEDIQIVSDRAKFMKLYYEATGIKSIVAFSNKKVNAYNKSIKKSDSERLYEVGDTLVMQSPICSVAGDIKLRNNQYVEIANVKEIDSQPWVNKYNGQDERGLEYMVETTCQNTFFIPANKTQDEGIKEHLRTMAKNNNNWKEFYRYNDTRCLAKHTFSSTVHKSQGSTYDYIFIDAKDIMEGTIMSQVMGPDEARDTFLRLLYVALTRARKKAFILT